MNIEQRFLDLAYWAVTGFTGLYIIVGAVALWCFVRLWRSID